MVFIDGGFNLGRMTFSFNRNLDYSPPVANAGGDLLVILPESVANLDGSSSYDLDTEYLSYQWNQTYGPTIVTFSAENSSQTEITGLSEGVYKFKLIVSDDSHSSQDYVHVFVSSTSSFPPTVTLNTSSLNSNYYYGASIILNATANDIDGTIDIVKFFDNENLIGEDSNEPYSYFWENIDIGIHAISAQAFFSSPKR